MGRPLDEQIQRMPPMSSARRRALRTVLSALAGGGLTAASLGGPLVNVAMGAEAATSTPASTEGATTQPASPASPTTEATSTQPTTSTPTASAPAAAPATTTPTSTTPAPSAAPEVPVVVLQRKQKATPSVRASVQPSPATTTHTAKPAKATGHNNVAGSPQSIAQAGSLAAILASSQASAEALAFYRIPAFLLPIYKAAAVQYGVPWQILAAINEIETDYGTDQAVSSAGAVGWMQFMPSTWLQYGVDALDAGYADPYNPVDAIFAAARYLRAAGAATNLRGAILAYNHSEEYAESVLLRAKLISTYPKAVIATLTGLIDGRLPVTGKQVGWSQLLIEQLPPSSATAGATAKSAKAKTASTPATSALGGLPNAATPGSSAAPSPAVAAAAATSPVGAAASALGQTFGVVDIRTKPNAAVIAVQDGRVVQLGHSKRLGKFIVLRDVYGDVFTYAGLGSIAPTYTLPKPTKAKAAPKVVEVASTPDPAPSEAASAGSQAPVTLKVKAPKPKHLSKKVATRGGQASVPTPQAEEESASSGKVRLFAHPGNPDARAAAVANAARRVRAMNASQVQPLRTGSVVTSGTVLGHVRVPVGAKDGHMRFAIRPAGDGATVDPGPILANWAQLQTALHPKGAKAADPLLGATASDVFLLSKAQLERSVLSDPGITIYECGRRDIAAGFIDKRVLAVMAFLSRSGLKPTISALRCGQAHYDANGESSAAHEGDALDISAINGIPIAGHQGPGTITDLTIRTLMTLPGEFVPHEIVSLMRYPGVHNTHASAAYWNQIHLDFRPVVGAAARVSAQEAAHSAASGPTAPAPIVTTSVLSPVEWNQLVTRVGSLQMPHIDRKPSSQAVPDPKTKTR
jgi:membrane-bound lytic murein transglycosylase B